MSAGPVRFELDSGVGRIVLSRPDQANAIDLRTARAFAQAVEAAAAAEVRSVLVSAEGPTFCGGGDLREAMSSPDVPVHLEGLASTMGLALDRLSELAKPVVCATTGAVAGGGLGLMLASDLVVAGRSTRVLAAYAAVGLTPDCGVSRLLPQVVGLRRSLELGLTARVLNAVEAHEWGLVTEVVDDDQVDGRALALARELADGPALALGLTKRLLRAGSDASASASRQAEVTTLRRAAQHPDAGRLMRSFVARTAR